MTKSLIDGVKEVAKRTALLTSSETILSLTDSQRQHELDSIVQVWNESIDELYRLAGRPRPNAYEEATLVLVTDTNAYEVNSSAESIRWPLVDRANGNYILRYPGGYHRIIEDHPVAANYTGLPNYGAIRPSDGYIYLDKIPTSDYNGRTYTYIYEKNKALTSASDAMPFSDTVFRAMVPVVAYIWELDRRKRSIPAGLLKANLARALDLLSRETYEQPSYWVMRPRSDINITDPIPG